MASYLVYIPISNEVDYPTKIEAFIGAVNADVNALQDATASMPAGNHVPAAEAVISDNALIRGGGDNESTGDNRGIQESQGGTATLDNSNNMAGLNHLSILGNFISSGTTLDADELGYLENAIKGAVVNGKAVILSDTGTLTSIDIDTDGLKINGSIVNTTASELNQLYTAGVVTADFKLIAGLAASNVQDVDLQAVDNFYQAISSTGTIVTLHRNIVLGDDETTLITFNADTKEHITPHDTNTWDLGSDSEAKRFRALYLSDVADIGSLKVNAGNEITDIVTTVGSTDTKIPTEKAVQDYFKKRTISAFFNYGDGSDGAQLDNSADWTVEPGVYNFTTYEIANSYDILVNNPGPLIIKATISIIIGNGSIVNADYMGASGGGGAFANGDNGIFGGAGGGGNNLYGGYGGGTFANARTVRAQAGTAQSTRAIGSAISAMPGIEGGGGGASGNSYLRIGGNGGGVIILIAPTITLTGSSFGSAGGNAVGAYSGGGGGGAIIVAAETTIGTPAFWCPGGLGAATGYDGADGWYRGVSL